MGRKEITNVILKKYIDIAIERINKKFEDNKKEYETKYRKQFYEDRNKRLKRLNKQDNNYGRKGSINYYGGKNKKSPVKKTPLKKSLIKKTPLKKSLIKKTPLKKRPVKK